MAAVLSGLVAQDISTSGQQAAPRSSDWLAAYPLLRLPTEPPVTTSGGAGVWVGVSVVAWPAPSSGASAGVDPDASVLGGGLCSSAAGVWPSARSTAAFTIPRIVGMSGCAVTTIG